MKIEKSVIADGAAKVKGVKIGDSVCDLKVKIIFAGTGFVFGIISSIIASIIYDYIN